MGALARAAGVQVLIRGTSTLRNLENYHKLMGKKQGTYLKSYGAFMKVGSDVFVLSQLCPAAADGSLLNFFTTV